MHDPSPSGRRRPVRHVALTLAVGLAGSVALAACGSSGSASGDSTPRTTAAVAGPPVPTTLPPWIPPALGVAGEEALVEVVRQDLNRRGLQFAVDEAQGTVSLADGRVLVLATVAEAVAGTDPTTWPGVVSRTFDVLLAP
ncbi:MAG TPA: hypothetical protein VF076_07345 [Acidimicrobiales bacterium]